MKLFVFCIIFIIWFIDYFIYCRANKGDNKILYFVLAALLYAIATILYITLQSPSYLIDLSYNAIWSIPLYLVSYYFAAGFISITLGAIYKAIGRNFTKKIIQENPVHDSLKFRHDTEKAENKIDDFFVVNVTYIIMIILTIWSYK